MKAKANEVSVKPVDLTAERQWLEDKKVQINAIMLKIGEHIQEVGNILLEAYDTLTSRVYEELVKHLKVACGWKDEDIEAAKRVAEGKLDAGLFFAGVSSRKIFNLPPDVRDTLLSIQHEIYRDDGSFAKLFWHEMTGTERDRLLGLHGTSILKPSQQDRPKPKSNSKKKVTRQFHDAKLDEDNDALVLRDGTDEVSITVDTLCDGLDKRDDLEKLGARFQARIEAKLQEMVEA